MWRPITVGSRNLTPHTVSLPQNILLWKLSRWGPETTYPRLRAGGQILKPTDRQYLLNGFEAGLEVREWSSVLRPLRVAQFLMETSSCELHTPVPRHFTLIAAPLPGGGHQLYIYLAYPPIEPRCQVALSPKCPCLR